MNTPDCNQGYGVPKHKSKAAQAQGGRDEEPLHIMFYLEGVAKLRYKVTEIGEVPYLPTYGGIQVFKNPARDMLPGLGVASGPDAVVLPHAELRKWEDKGKIQNAILTTLNFVKEEHHEEWNQWFRDIPTVSDPCSNATPATITCCELTDKERMPEGAVFRVHTSRTS